MDNISKRVKKQREIYKKHRNIISLIYCIGNKVAIKKQVIEVMLMIGFYKTEKQVYDAIAELNKYALVDNTKTLEGTKLKVVMLKNPAIKWVAEELDEKSRVRHGPNAFEYNKQSLGYKMTDDAVYKSIFKIEHFKNDFPIIKEHYGYMIKKDDFKLIDLMFEIGNKNSIVYTKCKGFEYLYRILIENKINGQHEEFSSVIKPLRDARKKKKKSVPDKKGKTKEYTENKRKERANKDRTKEEELTVEEKRLNKIARKYTFNSFLDSQTMVLEFDRYSQGTKTFKKSNKSIPYYHMYFKLYIYDMEGSMHYIGLAEKIKNVYLLLETTFGRETLFVSNNKKCMNCEYYYAGKKYKDMLKQGNLKGAKGCYPGTEHQRLGCQEVISRLKRDIYLDVVYIARNQKKCDDMIRMCNKIGYDKGEPREYPNLKHRVTLTKTDFPPEKFDEFVSVSYVNYNIDKYFEKTGLDNLIDYNNKRIETALIKEELKEEFNIDDKVYTIKELLREDRADALAKLLDAVSEGKIKL